MQDLVPIYSRYIDILIYISLDTEKRKGSGYGVM